MEKNFWIQKKSKKFQNFKKNKNQNFRKKFLNLLTDNNRQIFFFPSLRGVGNVVVVVVAAVVGGAGLGGRVVVEVVVVVVKGEVDEEGVEVVVEVTCRSERNLRWGER
jgi:hypothetical protein